MRNWLRKWLGIDRIDSTVNSLAGEESRKIDRRITAIESIDSNLKPLGAGTTIVIPLEAEVHRLGILADGNVDADNAILKRMLAVEKMLGLAPEQDLRGSRTIPMELESQSNCGKSLGKRLDHIDTLLGIDGNKYCKLANIPDAVIELRDWQTEHDKTKVLVKVTETDFTSYVDVRPTAVPLSKTDFKAPKKSLARPKKKR